MAVDPITYLPKVSWETMCKNVVVLTDWTYRITISPENLNDKGAGEILIGYYVIDNNGEQYTVSGLNVGGVSGNIEITDEFKVGYGPVTDRTMLICQSVGEGKAPFISPAQYDRLDSTARAKRQSIELDILWKSIKRNFIELLDCPESYVDQALKSLRVNAAEDGIEFYTPIGSNDIVQTLTGLTPSWDVSLGTHAKLTLSGNTVITLSNLVAGMSGNLTITNPATVYTLTFSGYTNELSPAIWKADNQPIISGLSLKDCFSWYYDGILLLWNGTNGYKP